MKHATDDDLKMIEGLITGGDGSVTLRQQLAAALVDELRKHRQHQHAKDRTKDQGTFEASTIISSRDGEPKVNLYIDGQHMQLDLPKAREVRGILDGVIEAALSDALLYRFLRERVGLDDERAGRALLDFREMRQGSRGTVYPS
jgi:hypothetical protein